METPEDRIARLQAELAKANSEADAQRKAIKEATPPVWEFTIIPKDNTNDNWDRIFDPTIVAYILTGRVVNEEEVKEIGYSDFEIRGGGMQYLYNTVTKKLVSATGGGTIYLSEGWAKKRKGYLDKAIDQINAFLSANPKGGDITSIINELRRKNKEE